MTDDLPPDDHPASETSRRTVLTGGLGLTASVAIASSIGLAAPADAARRHAKHPAPAHVTKGATMTTDSYVTTKDGVQIFFKDWGPKTAQAIMFHHGWPLSSDDWDTQMMYFLSKGFRVVAHDRRGHGRSSQVSDGHDMDHYAADANAVVEHLDLKNAIHIGHSTGGGEVARYVAKFGGNGRVAKAVLVSAVTPIMLKTDAFPNGLPVSVFDGIREQTGFNRAQFYKDLPIPFYNFNRDGVKPIDGVIDNWWRQGMTGAAKAHYDGIKAFSETDLSGDLKAIDVPVLILHGDDDQIVPYKAAALEAIKLVKHGTLKIYPGYPHGMLTTHADTINPDILAFIQA